MAKAKTGNPHAGHRERVKEEFLSRGFDSSTPSHKILELLLFYCIPRIDTNVVAHELIDRYKTISGVLDAPVEELLEFKGITRNNVGLLKMIMPIANIYRSEKQPTCSDFSDYAEISRFITAKFEALSEEKFGVLFLDGRGHNLGFEFIGTGSISSVGISSRDIIKRTFEHRANAVVLAHNHPNGVALPSPEDAQNTENIASALSHVDVRLLDHIIVADGDYVSMRQSRNYCYIFE